MKTMQKLPYNKQQITMATSRSKQKHQNCKDATTSETQCPANDLRRIEWKEESKKLRHRKTNIIHKRKKDKQCNDWQWRASAMGSGRKN